ncbi:FMN-binding negative transcriptional regulator [Oricola sp.]|uniref:FMN-binding negative transcriptional regulator n=1 Tax=Oricola sp. TaxID=1979950 RepID=UPI0025EF65C4|nr:FMN-binding negative transcriptional regulator [Oricola sp.]MCI5078198.1 FMN-binding negative transcriptional regulator [Oricola sp.]
MYQPAAFQENDPAKLAALAREIQFGCIVTGEGDALYATHAPCLIREDGGRYLVEFHVAKANRHWQIDPAAPTVAIFQGDHAYIHPGWYATKAETGKVVPTWTYVTVHMHGRLERISDPRELERLLADLTDLHEQAQPQPWAMSDAPRPYTERMMNAIVGLRLHVERAEGALKLNQHKNDADQDGVIDGLRGSGPLASRVADRMDRTRQNLGEQK